MNRSFKQVVSADVGGWALDKKYFMPWLNDGDSKAGDRLI
jgi:hypothetical protein